MKAMLALFIAAAISLPATGRFVLPAGVVTVASEIRVPEGAHDLVVAGNPKGTTVRAAPGFQGRALIVCERAKNVRIMDFAVDGGRGGIPAKAGLPPSDVPFARFYRNNGILVDETDRLTVSRIRFANVWAFPLLVSRSSRVRVEAIEIADSGSRNAKGRNNTTGGLLLEEGVTDFEVRRSIFTNISGNAVWTHSNYGSPRNARGLIADNSFREIGRDAIQVGHATGIRVERNTGSRIGYPFNVVDIEGAAMPVGVDTSGDVDHSVYAGNHFEEVNGKCIDLDGFHDGEVVSNSCVNKGAAEDYPNGQFGIVINNANVDMRSENITIMNNTIDGAKYGGMFVIGSRHRIERNRLLNVNLARCNESGARFGCLSIPGQPDFLQSGIYLAARAERPDPSRKLIIRNNVITGHKMSARCIMAAPGVSLKLNTIANNRCEDVK
jgi:hypothetical protein